ncbi:isocitrate lyase/phosphoenolpyruvate mutase family protein [Streptomyces sp. NPDC001796]|uniref:isocitrate lyase/phosphoenolpyruvate mutase family protein n=1 Tax=Streptomyces sp. NPDC001796 TaxID=3364609 RepID=UPI0036843416
MTVKALAEGIEGPLNAMAGPGAPTVAELAALCVARISVGSGIAQAAHALVRRAARELLDAGTYDALAGRTTYWPPASTTGNSTGCWTGAVRSPDGSGAVTVSGFPRLGATGRPARAVAPEDGERAHRGAQHASRISSARSWSRST